MPLPSSLSEVTVFKQPNFDKREKRRKRIKFGFLLLIIFLSLGVTSLIKVVNIWPHFLLPADKKGEIIKPIPDFSFEEELKIGLKKINLEVAEISFLNKKDREIFISGGLRVIVTKEKKLNQQLASLQLIINRFKIEGRNFKKVDLRFKNPIIE